MKNIYQNLFKNGLTIALTVVVSSLLVVGVIYATTTIGTNISTGGTLSVTSNATTSANLVVGTTSWDAPTSTLTVVGNAHFFNKATTSDGLWLGTGGTAGVDMTGGDLYVQGGAEFDGAVTLGDATADTITINGHIANATTTGNLVVGTSSWAAPTSTLTVVGNAHFFTLATTSEAVWIGTGGTANNVDLAAGDLYVQGGAELDGGLWVSSATTTDSLVVGGAASTTDYLVIGNNAGDDDDFIYFDIGRNEYFGWDDNPGEFVLTDDLNVSGAATTTGKTVFGATAAGANATTTMTFGSYGSANGGSGICLKFFSGGLTIWCYFNSGLIGSTATSTSLICSTNSCE